MKKYTHNLSFWKLAETMDSALLDGGEESKAMRVVRTGIGLRSKKDCGNFWDDFIAVCNDGEGLAELLDISTEKIGGWATKIKEVLDKVETADGVDTKKTKMVSTGTEPVKSAAETDVDTRPMP